MKLKKSFEIKSSLAERDGLFPPFVFLLVVIATGLAIIGYSSKPKVEKCLFGF